MEMLKLKICDKNDINDIMELQREVIESLADKSLLRNNQHVWIIQILRLAYMIRRNLLPYPSL